jgi:hypothetical protein
VVKRSIFIFERKLILNSALSTLTHARTARLNRPSSLVYSNRQSPLLSRQSLFLSRLIALTEGTIALSLDFTESLLLSHSTRLLSHTLTRLQEESRLSQTN